MLLPACRKVLVDMTGDGLSAGVCRTEATTGAWNADAAAGIIAIVHSSNGFDEALDSTDSARPMKQEQ